MKFTFPIAEMVRTLNVLGKVIQKSCPMPIVQNVLITKPDPKEEVYLMTAGSAESMMTIKVNITMVDGTAFKPICIPHGQFLQVLSALPEQPITVEVDDTTREIKVLYDGGEFVFAGFGTDEYPVLKSSHTNLVTVSVPTDILLPCVSNALLASAKKNELRPVLSSVYLDIKDDGITFVGTDGHNLFRYVWEHGVPFITEGKAAGVVVQNIFVSALLSAFDKVSEVKISFDGYCCTVSADNITFIFSTSEQRYPNYSSVIPKDQPYHITLDRDRLKQSLRRVSMMASEANNLVKLTKQADGLLLEAVDIDFARSANELVPLGEDSNIPDGFTIGMKSSSLLNMLSSIASTNVVLKLIDASRALVLTEEGNSALICVVMPMVV